VGAPRCRSAPGGPQVDQDRFPFQRLQLPGLAGQVRQFKRRNRFLGLFPAASASSAGLAAGGLLQTFQATSVPPMSFHKRRASSVRLSSSFPCRASEAKRESVTPVDNRSSRPLCGSRAQPNVLDLASSWIHASWPWAAVPQRRRATLEPLPASPPCEPREASDPPGFAVRRQRTFPILPACPQSGYHRGPPHRFPWRPTAGPCATAPVRAWSPICAGANTQPSRDMVGRRPIVVQFCFKEMLRRRNTFLLRNRIVVERSRRTKTGAEDTLHR